MTSSDALLPDSLTILAGDLVARLSPRGARLMRLSLRGRAAPLTEVPEDGAALAGPSAYDGAVVGPVANRIAGASATLDGVALRFPPNEAGNLLHGGAAATSRLDWEVVEAQAEAAAFRLSLPDGAGGFPGAREIIARFAAEAPARLTLTLTARTDLPTFLNLANHSYWRLGDTQRLSSPAGAYLPVDGAKLPTGEVAGVADTRFDFRTPREVGGKGYDHCLCLARARGPLAPAAMLEGGGVRMTVETTEPGLQVYDGRGDVVALEPQGWPDAPNRPDFPSVRLDPGETYRQITRWSFSAI